MTRRQDDLLNDFVRGAKKGTASNICIEDNTLYYTAWGSMPLLLKMPHWNSSSLKYDMGFILNADSISSGWGGGSSNIQWSCGRYATIQVPFSALNQALGFTIIKSSDLEALNIIDKAKQRWDILGYKHFDTGEKISVEEFDNLSTETQEEYTKMHERRPEGVVLEYKGKYLLSSMDGASYFLVELPCPVKTVKEAFDSLIPIEVRGKEYTRQGEWFFTEINIPQKEANKTYKYSLVPKFNLPHKVGGNIHWATRGGFMTDIAFTEIPDFPVNPRTLVVSGQIHHPEHGMLSLSSLGTGIKLFAAFENYAKNSWSVIGRVD